MGKLGYCFIIAEKAEEDTTYKISASFEATTRLLSIIANGDFPLEEDDDIDNKDAHIANKMMRSFWKANEYSINRFSRQLFSGLKTNFEIW